MQKLVKNFTKSAFLQLALSLVWAVAAIAEVSSLPLYPHCLSSTTQDSAQFELIPVAPISHQASRELSQRIERIIGSIAGDDVRAYLGFVPQIRLYSSVLPNAFAHQRRGQPAIFISTGLIEYVQSDDELAFMLTHEIAHLRLRHFEHVHNASNSELISMELEADQLASRILAQARIPLYPAKDLLLRLSQFGKDQGFTIAPIFPSLQQRISSIEHLEEVKAQIIS